jgi:hypothetical protein
MNELQQFAEIDSNNTVIRTIAATQDFIDSGVVGDPARWLEIIDNNGNLTREHLAFIGTFYDRVADVFIEHPDMVEMKNVNNELASQSSTGVA